MSWAAQALSHEAEIEFLQGLRSRYEAEGFSFIIAPDRSMLPEFLGTYVPDALARKPNLNIAIEVKQRQTQATQARLQEIRRLFEGHPDWQFSVVFMGSRPLQSIIIPAASPGAIRERIDEARALSAQGHQRAAFVMAWTLLEAVLQSAGADVAGRPRGPGAVVQALAMEGYIGPDMERRMRELIDLRNRIVHGDVVAEPTADQVNLVLEATEEALVANAA